MVLGILHLKETRNNHFSFLSAKIALLWLLLPTGSLVADDWSPLWSTGTLSQGRVQPATAAAGGKAFFGGGGGDTLNELYSNVVDVYDASTASWSSMHLSLGRKELAAASANNKVLFAGGAYWDDWLGEYVYYDRVDIYNTATGSWSTSALPAASRALAGTSIGNKVLFGGGSAGGICIYDTETGVWSTVAMSGVGVYCGAASANGKALFAGGYVNGASNAVGIYDAATGTCTPATLSQARYGVNGTAIGTRVFFAGGYVGTNASDVVDIYDTVSGTWSVKHLSIGRGSMGVTTVGSKVFFAGGDTGHAYSSVVDVYDTNTNTWSTATLSAARTQLAATTVGNKAIFAGGYGGTKPLSDNVDIYTTQDYPTITSSKAWTLVDQTSVSGRMQLNSGATLNLDGYNLTVGSMGGVAPINLSTHTLRVGTDNTDSTYSGQITGSGSLEKTGNGKLTLTATNGYTGPTMIGSGTLVIDGSLASASAVTVQNGGTLGGVGSVGSVAVNLGGHIAPGELAGSIGVLTLNGGLSLANGAKFNFDLTTPRASDLISMSSFTLTLSNQQFSDFAFNPEDGFGPGIYTLIDAGNIQGSLSGLFGSLNGTIEGRNASISTVGDDLVLTVVPEPPTLVLLGAVALSLLAYVRQRSKIAGPRATTGHQLSGLGMLSQR